MRAYIRNTIIISTKAAAVALVFCYLALYGARWITALHLITPFIFQYSIGCFILSIILIVLKCKNWAIGVAFLALLFGGEYINSNKLFAPQTSVVNDGYKLDVISFNQLRYNEHADTFLRTETVKNKDLIVIIEANKNSAKQAEKMRDVFPHQFYALGLSSKSMIILSRWPLRDLNRIKMFDNDPAQNFIVKFKLQPSPSHNPLQVYALHTKAPLPFRRIKERNAEIDYLAQLIARDQTRAPQNHILAMGDFNITPYNPYFKDLLTVTSLRIPSSYSLPPHSWPSTFPWLLRFQIDHILISTHITPLSFKTIKGVGSDHLALSARLHIPPTQHPPSTSIY